LLGDQAIENKKLFLKIPKLSSTYTFSPKIHTEKKP
jgi:hypothetical protein